MKNARAKLAAPRLCSRNRFIDRVERRELLAAAKRLINDGLFVGGWIVATPAPDARDVRRPSAVKARVGDGDAQLHQSGN
jgi:hypothetical protein